MLRFFRYKLTIRHDGGRFNLVMVARNKRAAAEMVCKCEGCPRSAIVAIRRVK